ncbi:MAG TPA: HesA/MoeB/ThiF family protein [Thermoflexia bacterium]|nr:HesA/MoeB/ThiF family protein [Thermoflexia bacterium]
MNEVQVNRRYARQIAIPQIGVAGQARLQTARVLVIGAGGLGSPALFYLAAAGVGTLGIADDDLLSSTNLNRQILYTPAGIGRNKVEQAARRLRAFNPEITIIPHIMRVSRANGPALIADYDLVVEATDNLASKALINELCVRARVPLVWAGVQRFEGQLSVVLPGHACRRCIFPELPEPGSQQSPAELGIIGATAGVIGTLQALEALKVLLGIGTPLVDQLLLWDGLHHSFEKIQVTRTANCPHCGQNEE